MTVMVDRDCDWTVRSNGHAANESSSTQLASAYQLNEHWRKLLGDRWTWVRECNTASDVAWSRVLQSSSRLDNSCENYSLVNIVSGGWSSFLGHCCSSVERCSVVCSFCAIIAAVPPRPQDGTVSVIVLFTIVFGCMTDCNLTFNTVRCPCNGLVREVSP